MAPTTRSKASLKTILFSPAKLIRKKLRTNVKLQTNSRLFLASTTDELSCTHNVSDTCTTSEERELRDLCIEDAASYSELAEINGQEIHRLLSNCESIWTVLWRGPLARGGALTSSQRNAHKSFHENLLLKLKATNTEMMEVLWRKPRMSCRQHLDIGETRRQINNMHSITTLLFEELLKYIERCPSPVNVYGTRCNLTTRERLTEANCRLDQAKEKLRKICVRDGQRLETQFHQFIASCDALNEFLSGISPGNSLVLNMEE
ncbi:uncharacterized protein LOC111259742 [Varroa jacobsoni]|nr:uncharacterized protein LOC111254179 isoform X2 [Varroa destructor]XP_022670492.1 uncharacterized protein LOC111254179 isoform X2 [Varroa destructor]XP_022670493.1 uncharacterized protein LOC111254179 isoform X2 [Varroa destructor]XP_022670494.1 uncharacterized protein LOC111254179 isoform X2 [Varroa destructor]XP_022687688.1 uncharacterized protein LOC111259742 [Varroa jacobsoni]